MIGDMVINLLDTTGRRIKAVREHEGLTQIALAEKLGIRQAYMSQLENDKSIAPADLLATIAQVLDVSADYLLLLSDDAERQPTPELPGISPEAEEAARLVDSLRTDAQRQYCIVMLREFVTYREKANEEWAGVLNQMLATDDAAALSVAQGVIAGEPVAEIARRLNTLLKAPRQPVAAKR